MRCCITPRYIEPCRSASSSQQLLLGSPAVSQRTSPRTGLISRKLVGAREETPKYLISQRLTSHTGPYQSWSREQISLRSLLLCSAPLFVLVQEYGKQSFPRYQTVWYSWSILVEKHSVCKTGEIHPRLQN